jgi:hypothetical protein
MAGDLRNKATLYGKRWSNCLPAEVQLYDRRTFEENRGRPAQNELERLQAKLRPSRNRERPLAPPWDYGKCGLERPPRFLIEIATHANQR